VKATDRDVGVNAELVYRFSPQTLHADLFTVEPDTGQIYIRSALDFERNNEYHLTVMACDGNQLRDDDERKTQPGTTDNAANKVLLASFKLSWPGLAEPIIWLNRVCLCVCLLTRVSQIVTTGHAKHAILHAETY